MSFNINLIRRNILRSFFYEQSELPKSKNKISRGSMKETLKHLGKYERIKENDISLGESCVICSDEFEVNFYKRQLECHHVFHKKCIDKWLYQSVKMDCPICRRSYIT